MPSTEKPLRLEFSVPQSCFTVNGVLDHVRALPVAACALALAEYQEQILTAVLGPAWAPVQQGPAPWSCPKCESLLGFGRRGSRTRRLRTSLGVVVFGLRQVTCHSCEATFSPFPKLLGLPERARVSEELLHKTVDVATRLSYQQSSEVTHALTGQRVSAWRIHKEVQQRAQNVDLKVPEEAPILLLDSTKVKAGKKQNGIDFNLALAVSGVSQVDKRKVLEKTVIAMGVGNWASLKERLRQVKPRLILLDGDDELERLVAELYPGVPVQRCLWHLARTFAYYLWKGSVPKDIQETLIQTLRLILHKPLDDPRGVLSAFADLMDQPQYKFAQHLLYKACETAFTDRTLQEPLPGGRNKRRSPIATSYIERQMREVNRRADVGARWTPPGIDNLLRLRMVRRLEPDHWNALWSCTTGN